MIWGNIGRLSSGKTVFSVALALDNKKPIITNMKLKEVNFEYFSNEMFLDWLGKTMLKSRDERDKEIISKFYGKTWLLDELHNLADARRSGTKINLDLTQFVTMLGKLNVDVFYTTQILESQIDLRIRELSDVTGECRRIDLLGNPLFFKKRKIKEDILIEVELKLKVSEFNVVSQVITFDPKSYFRFYDTEEIILLKR